MEIRMKRIVIAMLSVCLVSGAALAADKGATSTAKGDTMSKDAMGKDAMSKDAMSKDAMAGDPMVHGTMSTQVAKSKHPAKGKTKAGKTHEATKAKGAM
jgi:pentapeptide MXKDX repeat protein